MFERFQKKPDPPIEVRRVTGRLNLAVAANAEQPEKPPERFAVARLIRGERSAPEKGDVPGKVHAPEKEASATTEVAPERDAPGRDADFGADPTVGFSAVTPHSQQNGAAYRLKNVSPTLRFALFVGLPLILLTAYMFLVARPQYASTTAFTVRAAENGVGDTLSGLAQFTGASRNTDALILAEFLESQTLVQRLNDRVNLVRHYSAPFESDPLFALPPDASIEGRLTHWRRMVRVEHDQSTGLLDLRIHAFSPEMAQLLARELLVESRILLNELNADARATSTALAEAELAVALQDLNAARAALTEFRTESRIFDPNTDFDGRMVVLRHLQGELAQALVAQDLNRGDTNGPETARVVALRERISLEQETMGEGIGANDDDYATVLATLERLTADRNFAEAAYRSARNARDLALAQSARMDLYLAVYVQPTLPERADHTQRVQIIGLTALFLGLLWAIATLVSAAIRDRR